MGKSALIRNTIAAIAFGAVGGAQALTIALPPNGNTWIQGTSFKGGSTIEVSPPEQFPYKGTLADDFNYSVADTGISLKGGTEISFFANKIASFGTVFSGVHGNIQIRPGSGIFFHSNGNPKNFLPDADTLIGVGNYKIPIKGGAVVSTHLNGSIASATSIGEFFYAIPGSPISFYFGAGSVLLDPSEKVLGPNGFILGAIRQATLSRNHITNSQPLEVIPAGAEVTIDARGDLRRISNTKPFTFRTGVLTAGGTVEIGVDYTARIFTFGAFTYNGKTYPAGRTIIMTNAGVLSDF